MAARVEWGEFEYDGQSLLYDGYARMPPDQFPGFLLTADGDDRPHAWWLAQTRLYDLRGASATPSTREVREMLANAIRHGRLVVPEALVEAERNAEQFLHLSRLRDQFSRRHVPPPTPRTSPPPRVPATPSRAPSPRPATTSPRATQGSPPGAMSLQGMLAQSTLMSLPLAAPVPVPGPTPHPLPLFTLVPQSGGIPVPAPGPNPPPLVPAYARYAAYTTTTPSRNVISPSNLKTSPTPPKPAENMMDQDERRSETASEPTSPRHAEIDELEDERPKPYFPEAQPQDRPKKRSRQTRPVPSSEPRVCTTCSRTDSPEWRRGPCGPKTLCNACGLKWAKASGAGRRRQPVSNPPHAPEWTAARVGAEIHRVGSAGPVYVSPAGTSLGVPMINDLARSAPVPGDLSTARPAPGDLAVTRVHELRPNGAAEMTRALSDVGRSTVVPALPPPPKSSSSSDTDEARRPVEPRVDSGLMSLANVALENRRDTSLKRPRADSNFERLEGGTRPIDPISIDKW